MRILIVLAHPVAGSFAATVAATAKTALENDGHGVDLLDLYREDFDPRLSEAERRGYFDIPYDAGAVAGIAARLQAADGLILVFPQWWFNFPAILKGFFDRVLAPGIAFDHDLSGGRIVPRLTNIRLFLGANDDGVAVVGRQTLYGQPGSPTFETRHRRILCQGCFFPDDLAT